jgi:hypothetical protein
VRGREAEDRRPADVLPREVDRPGIEVPDEKVQVFGSCQSSVDTRP